MYSKKILLDVNRSTNTAFLGIFKIVKRWNHTCCLTLSRYQGKSSSFKWSLIFGTNGLQGIMGYLKFHILTHDIMTPYSINETPAGQVMSMWWMFHYFRTEYKDEILAYRKMCMIKKWEIKLYIIRLL